MCCRDGLDKPPKAPKNSSVPASTVVATSNLPPKGSTAQSRLELPFKKAVTKVPKGKIDKIDLTTEDEPPGFAKKTPRHVENLQKLHQDVVKVLSAPVMLQKKPSHDFSNGGQLQLSFLKGNNATSSDPKASTDYSDDWLEELPSPSELLEHTKKGDTAHEGLLNKSNKTVAEGAGAINEDTLDTNSLEEFDLSQFDDDHCDMEAAMVGLSDSIIMQENLQSPIRHASTVESDYVGTVTADLDTMLSRRSSKAAEPFLSTDSPEKTLPTIPGKRSMKEVLGDEDFFHIGPMQKRQKHDTEVNSALQPSTNAEDQQAAPAPVINPGQPGWVYDFDPAFIAEYQDIVDFV